jgi:rsbT co-antagonist protein RsbR
MEQQLARMNKERERMLEEVSTPIVPVFPGVLTLPLVGMLDTERMNRATDAALAEVSRTGAHTCIIDITGARIIDSHAVANLGNLVTALKLIGSDAIVTGVTAQAAQSLVGLGLDLSQIRTHRTLAQALAAVIGNHNSQGIGSRTNGTSINTR